MNNNLMMIALVAGAVLITGCNVGKDKKEVTPARIIETDLRHQDRDGIPGLKPILSSAPPSCQPDNYQGPTLVDVTVPAPTEDDPFATRIEQQPKPGETDYRQYPLCSDMRSPDYNSEGLTTWIDATVFVPEHRTGEKLPVILHTHGWGGSKLTALPVPLECAQNTSSSDCAALFEKKGDLSQQEGFAGLEQLLGLKWLKGYIIVSFTQRGWGESEGDIMLVNPYHETLDAVAVLDWVADMGRAGHLPVAVDARGDFPLTLYGTSYGAGFQWPLATMDPRPDAMVAVAGWNSLEQSLTPDGAVKGGWGGMLCLATILGRPHPYLSEACQKISLVSGMAGNLLSGLGPLLKMATADSMGNIELNQQMVAEFLQHLGELNLGLAKDALKLDELALTEGSIDLAQLLDALGGLFGGPQVSLDMSAVLPLLAILGPLSQDEEGLKIEVLTVNLLQLLIGSGVNKNNFSDQLMTADAQAFLKMSGVPFFESLAESGQGLWENDEPFVPRPMDVLLVQGMTDTLFSAQEAIRNYQYYNGLGGDVQLLTIQNGHLNPLIGQNHGSFNCGGIPTAKTVADWIDNKMGRASFSNQLMTKLCLSLSSNQAVLLDGIPGIEESLPAQQLSAEGFPSGDFELSIFQYLVATNDRKECPPGTIKEETWFFITITTCENVETGESKNFNDVAVMRAQQLNQCLPVYEAQENSILAGVPQLSNVAITARGRQPVQLGLCLIREGKTTVIDYQITAFDSNVIRQKGGNIELIPVAEPLIPGDQVGIYATAFSENMNFLSSVNLVPLAKQIASILEVPVVDEQGNPVLDAEGNPETQPAIQLTKFLADMAKDLLGDSPSQTIIGLGAVPQELETILNLSGGVVDNIIHQAIPIFAELDNEKFLTLLLEGFDWLNRPASVEYTLTGSIELPIFPEQHGMMSRSEQAD